MLGRKGSLPQKFKFTKKIGADIDKVSVFTF